jgi:hypothetical protein
VKVNELFERLPLPVKARLPAFAGATGWLTTKPLTPADLQGKVVLVDFWTYTCNQLDPDASARPRAAHNACASAATSPPVTASALIAGNCAYRTRPGDGGSGGDHRAAPSAAMGASGHRRVESDRRFRRPG